jgi:predicted outer membrane repeat protein
MNVVREFNLLIIFLIIISLFVIFSFGMDDVRAVSGNNIYVNTHGNDSWNGLNSKYIGGITGPKSTIKNATGTVKSNGRIIIGKGIYREHNITINTNMTITGENYSNTIISGDKMGRIFYILCRVNVNIKNLSLKEGYAKDIGPYTGPDGHGGAIYNCGTLTAKNSKFANNNAQNYGGAIYNCGSLDIINTDFTENNADYYGGAIYNYKNGFLNMDNCNFKNNHGLYHGGAIYNVYNVLNIKNSIFTNNTSSFRGGAIYNSYNVLTINHSSFFLITMLEMVVQFIMHIIL